jgi:hypothetical protein
MLLHYVGEDVNDIRDAMTLPNPNGEAGVTVFSVLVDRINHHFEPEKCTDYHVYAFRNTTQKSSENLADYHMRLKLLAKRCEFADEDNEIRLQIIQGCTSKRLRRKAMEAQLSLSKMLSTAQAMELADQRTEEFDQHAHAVQSRPREYQPRPQKPFKYQQKSSAKCGLCGGNYPHQTKCPAQGKLCYVCGKSNHFSKVVLMLEATIENQTINLRVRINPDGKYMPSMMDRRISIPSRLPHTLLTQLAVTDHASRSS